MICLSLTPAHRRKAPYLYTQWRKVEQMQPVWLSASFRTDNLNGRWGMRMSKATSQTKELTFFMIGLPHTCTLEKSHLRTGEKSSKCVQCGYLHHLGQTAEMEDEDEQWALSKAASQTKELTFSIICLPLTLSTNSPPNCQKKNVIWIMQLLWFIANMVIIIIVAPHHLCQWNLHCM